MNIDSEAVSAVDRLVEERGGSPDQLVTILAGVQERFRHLPEAALRRVAEALDVPLVRVYGVATFYRAFSLEPRGRHTIHVCMGTACHVRGAGKVLAEFERELGVEHGRTTPDGMFTLESVNCVGACAMGPVVVIDEISHGHMTPGKVRAVLDQHAEKQEATP